MEMEEMLDQVFEKRLLPLAGQGGKQRGVQGEGRHAVPNGHARGIAG
jgi:hypothetical protein